MSGYTWQLIEWFKNNRGKSQTKLAINSNLGMPREKLDEFIEITRDIPHLEIYTSNESTGLQAEYIRDGMEYDLWLGNFEELLKNDHIRAVHSMCTINALCLDSLPEYLEQLVVLKKKYDKERVNFTLNILRFPSFQSPLVLPDEIRTHYKNRLGEFMTRHKGQNYMHEHEINHLQRLIDYLDVVKTPHSDAFDMPKLHNDFYLFHQQYDSRRGKEFGTTFPNLKEWYDSIQV